MKPLWNVKGFCNRTSWKVSDVQIDRFTWVLVARDKSNQPVADSLRSLPQESWSWSTLSGKANDWRNREHVSVCAVLRMSKWSNLKTSVGKRPSRLSLEVARCSMQCSECHSGEKFKQTRVNGGSIHDSLKVTSSECQSDGNLNQAWVNGGRSHDSLKVVSALIVQVMEI